MDKQEILAREPKILAQKEREHYFSEGYVSVAGLVKGNWLKKLQNLTAEFIEASRTAERDDKRFDFEPDHSADNPRLRRLNHPLDLHNTFWEFASTGTFADVAEDLLGPDFKFHHSKLNFKWADGGEEVKWHQDIPFWPHTNYDVLTLGCYLEDVEECMAPMGVISKSHAGPLFDHYEGKDWKGYISNEDLGKLAIKDAVYLGGVAGSVTAHNCRTVHGSAPNSSAKTRPLFLCAYSAADSVPLTDLVVDQKYSEQTIRGTPSKWPRFDERACPLPPPWRRMGGYTSIFDEQKD